MKYLVILLLCTLFCACNKPDPTPETSDEVYKDLLQELDVATKGLESEQANLAKLKSELGSIIPQTGQIKFAQKKIFETENTITKIAQQKQFFEIKIELRKQEVRNRYNESRHGGRKWPDPDEIENYKSTIKLQREKLSWEKNKGVKKDVPRGTEKNSGSGSGQGSSHESAPTGNH